MQPQELVGIGPGQAEWCLPYDQSIISQDLSISIGYLWSANATPVHYKNLAQYSIADITMLPFREHQLFAGGDNNTVYSVNDVTLGLLRQWTQSTVSSARGDVVEVLFNAAFPDWDHPLTCYGEEEPPLDQTFANIAASLTQHMREQGEIDKWGLSSNAFWPGAYVHARWIWALLPVIVLALSTIFLITTIVVSALRDLPTWRGSALPAIVYGIDREIASAIIGDGPRLQAMEKEADQYDVSLAHDQEYWRFKGARRRGVADGVYSRI